MEQGAQSTGAASWPEQASGHAAPDPPLQATSPVSCQGDNVTPLESPHIFQAFLMFCSVHEQLSDISIDCNR